MSSVRMYRLLLFIGVLQLCCAKEPKCSTISSGTTTTYIIHEDHKYVQASTSSIDDDCDFSWCDSKDIVLANQQSKSALVKNWSINNLTIEGCNPALFLKRSCVSEGNEFTANCSASCDDSPKLPKDNDNPSNSTHLNDENRVVVPVAVVSAVIIIVVVVVGILYTKRKKIFRNGSCGQMGGIYSDMKPVNTNSNVV